MKLYAKLLVTVLVLVSYWLWLGWIAAIASFKSDAAVAVAAVTFLTLNYALYYTLTRSLWKKEWNTCVSWFVSQFLQ